MCIFKQNIRRTLSLLLLGLFLGYFVGLNFFQHTHVINGQLIVHSHPFSSTEQHSHSVNLIHVLQQLSHFDSKIVSLVLLIVVLPNLFYAFNCHANNVVLCAQNNSFNFLRPPPSYTL